MLREIQDLLIKDGKLYKAEDQAPLDCGGCAGCSSCCRESAVMIILDEYDMDLLKKNLNYTFEGLLSQGMVKLQVIDGIVLPGLGTDENGTCVFLDDAGRCRIHSFRPGICRMYPLARIYDDDGSFSYFVQDGECEKATGGLVRISDWLGYEDIREYEKRVRAYHDDLVALREKCAAITDQQTLAKIQLEFLKGHFEK